MARTGLIAALLVFLGPPAWDGSSAGQEVSEAPRPAADTLDRPAAGTERDWEIAREHFRWGASIPTDSLPHFGELVRRIAERFLDTPYEPRTLELPGPERLVVNLEALDCVTLVENVVVLARLAWSKGPEPGDDTAAFEDAYRHELTALRYRGGQLAGYPSRLHYFSEWIADNEASGVLLDLSRRLGGVPDSSAVDFMSTHPDAYRQLSDSAVLAAIASVEARIGAEARYYVPQDSIGAVVHGVRDGDIIAATSTVAGLDVAHTGIALWRDGELHLLHAPLVGSHVQISEESLAERILRIGSQDGIMVARPLPPGA